VSDIDDLLTAELKFLPPKPGDDARQSEKKAYSERMSEAVAIAFGHALRARNLKETMPAAGQAGPMKKGSERRMSGGLGAKNVDVTWATEESGLLLSISVKTINFLDPGRRTTKRTSRIAAETCSLS